jgi:hypothetical protein
MEKRKRKTARRDSIEAGEVPHLWPDENGALKIGKEYRAQSKELQLRRLRLLQREPVKRVLRRLRFGSFSSWLWLKNWGVVGFGMEGESLFEMWLWGLLAKSAFCALGQGAIVESAKEELGIDEDRAMRLLIKVTGAGGKFKADEGIVSARE